MNMQVTMALAKQILSARDRLKSRADENAHSSDACIIYSLCETMTAFTRDLVARAKSFELPESPHILEADTESFPLMEVSGTSNVEREGLAEAAEQLLSMLSWCEGRLKTLDISQRQLDLAFEIGKVAAKKKMDYYKVR